jgi:hypothetical protein
MPWIVFFDPSQSSLGCQDDQSNTTFFPLGATPAIISFCFCLATQEGCMPLSSAFFPGGRASPSGTLPKDPAEPPPRPPRPLNPPLPPAVAPSPGLARAPEPSPTPFQPPSPKPDGGWNVPSPSPCLRDDSACPSLHAIRPACPMTNRDLEWLRRTGRCVL